MTDQNPYSPPETKQCMRDQPLKVGTVLLRELPATLVAVCIIVVLPILYLLVFAAAWRHLGWRGRLLLLGLAPVTLTLWSCCAMAARDVWQSFSLFWGT